MPPETTGSAGQDRVTDSAAARPPFSHPADEHFVSLVDYLRHLVDRHGVDETPELWRSGRDAFDALHREAHDA